MVPLQRCSIARLAPILSALQEPPPPEDCGRSVPVPNTTTPMPSSLDLLNPRPWVSRRRIWASETAKEVEEISRRLIATTSARDWANPLFARHISSDYCAEFAPAGGVSLKGWTDYVGHHERLATANPDYGFETLDSVADIYENTGHGAVYMLLRVTGHPRHSVRESIIVFLFRRSDDNVWVCHGQKAVRGMFWNA